MFYDDAMTEKRLLTGVYLPPAKRLKIIESSKITTADSNPSLILKETKEFDGKIGFQVAKGVFTPCNLDQHALIIAEGWPSWSLAIDGLGFKTITTVASFSSLSSKYEFASTSLGPSLLNEKDLNNWLDTHTDVVIFIQGTRAFFENACTKITAWQEMRLVFCCSDSSFHSSDGWRETHEDAGGVTDGAWTFYSQNMILTPKDPVMVKRHLRHVLRTTEGATSTKLLKKFNSPTFQPDQRVRWKMKFPIVETFSVFDKLGPVTRLVSIDELLDIYDIELLIQGQLKSYWSSNNVKPTRSFVDQVPIKVLRSIGSRLIKSLGPIQDDTDDDSHSLADSDVTLLCNNRRKPDIASAHLPLDDVIESDNESIANELMPDQHRSKDKVEKAACDDDKEADEKDWDVWTVENFGKGIEEKPGLICNGTYDESIHGPLFAAMRDLLIRRYRKNVLRSFLRYMRLEHSNNKMVTIRIPELLLSLSVPKWTTVNRMKVSKKKDKSELLKDLEIGRDAVSRAAKSTWWNWDGGSTLFFWRWPRWSKKSVRDGTKLFVDWDKLPSYWKRQQWPQDEASCSKLKKKLSNVRAKSYVQPGFVKSLTSYFAVPKAKTDIRVVYDATACGLNEGLWAPNFFLPTVDSILRNASSSTWFGDIDLGEMFLNYPLDEAVRPYAGVDVSNVDLTELELKGLKRIIERWVRCLMGFKPSPYITTQTFAWSEEIIMGKRLDENNPFYWDTVILNLPGLQGYQPDKPWVYKWNSKKSIMASFFGTYIDDIRGGGATEIECRRSIHRTACRINYLGQQDAPRKRGQATQNPRAWAGSKCLAKEGEGLYVLCMDEKWIKSKRIINDLCNHVVTLKAPLVNYKSLESNVGFLCHISRTYPMIFPYLKGFYNTLNNWRCGRDKDGWKISKTAWLELIAGDISFEDENDIHMSFEDRKRSFLVKNTKDQPSEVIPVPRLGRDLKALQTLFSLENPPLRLIRGSSVNCALFGFGDASGGGFGSSWEVNKDTAYRFGTWSRSMDGESSNLRELMNLVETLEEMAEQDKLKGNEIFLFTDNSTSEAAFYSGSSSSEKLFDLVLRVKKLEMHHCTKIHIIHVAGERMKEQGSDGLSRGNLNVGVMAGKKMIDFVPIHLSAFERTPLLMPWIRKLVGQEAEFLEPHQWFTRGHDLDETRWEKNSDGMELPMLKEGRYVWSPPPCAGAAAVEELRKARHKRQKSQHLFVIPRLMQPIWRKHLYKAADLVIMLKPGHAAWPKEMHEPLTLAFVFPFISHKPWQLRGSIQLLALGRQLCQVWEENERDEGPILWKLWNYQRKLKDMPAKLASKLLQCEQVDGVSYSNPGKRRRGEVEEGEGRNKVFKRQKG